MDKTTSPNAAMSRLRQISLRKKIFLCFLVVIVGMGAMTAVIYGSLRSSYGKLNSMMTSLILMNQIDSTNGTLYDHASKFYTMRSEEDLDAAVDLLDDNQARLDELADALEDPNELKQLAALSGRLTEAKSYLDALVASVTEAKGVEDIRTKLNAIESMQSDISSKIGFLSNERFEMNRLLMIKMDRDNAVLFRILLAAALAIAVLSAGIALAMSNGLMKPLVAVSSTLSAISEGKGDLTARIDAVSRDEVGRLASAFNSFSGSLEEMVLGVRNSAEKLSKIGKTLESGVSENSASVEEISANVESISRVILDQSAGVEETQAAAGSIARVVSDLREKIAQQAASLAKSSEATERMIDVVVSVSSAVARISGAARALVEASSEGRTKLEAVNERMQAISSQSDSLAEANEVIVGIASQTNLLAMNAAIEAAHAGESGRGFSVVAEEIRKLAENSSQQAGSTKRDLDSIAQAIQEAAILEKDAEESFQRIFQEIGAVGDLERIVNEALDAEKAQSEDVRASLAEIDSVTVAVRTGADEVEKVSAAINEAMSDLSRITVEIQAGIGEISRGATHINQTMVASKSVSRDNAEAIEALRSQVGHFKVREDGSVR